MRDKLLVSLAGGQIAMLYFIDVPQAARMSALTIKSNTNENLRKIPIPSSP